MDASLDTLQRFLLDGENLRSGPNSPNDEGRSAFRKRYLSWVDGLHRAVGDQPEHLATFESTRWQMVVEGNVSDDEIVRTILGDIDQQLGQLRQVLADLDGASAVDRTNVPPRWIADPGTVGMAVFDATCLFSKHTRHLLLGFSVHGIVLGRWSRELLAEAAGNLAKKLRGDSLEDLGRWLKRETDLIRDGLVEEYKPWLAGLTLPDPGDEHVLASAIVCGATIIVTDNIKDFPAEWLTPYGIETQRPDDFALSCINANPVLATRVVVDHPDPALFLDKLTGQLPQAAALLRELLD